MASVIEICNMALANLGKPVINAMGDGSAEARACSRFYAQTRDLLLEAYPWRFAAKQQSLAEITNDKPALWRHCYARPVDCLKVRRVIDDPSAETCIVYDGFQRQHGHRYALESSKIYCDVSPAFLIYTARNEDPSKFTPLFTEALVWHLTVRLAMPLTRDARVRADAWQVAQNMLLSAQVADANDERHVYDHRSEFVEGRC